MKRVIYKKTGEVNKDTKYFPAILFRSRERNRNILIGNAPVEVSDDEYKILKEGKHGKDITLFTKNTKLPKPMEVVIKGSEKKYLKIVKEIEKKIKAKLGVPKAILKAGKNVNRSKKGKKK